MKTNKIEKLPINWADGVKIYGSHFTEQYYSVMETIKGYNASNQRNFDFGMLDPIDNNTSALDLELTNDSGNTLAVTLKSCHAIAKNGYRIIFYEGLYGSDFTPRAVFNLNNAEKNNNVHTYAILLSIHPFELVPIGYPDPECEPLHHPNVLPKLMLSLVPYNQVNTYFVEDNYLVVGQIVSKNGVFSIDENYLPPVKKVCYHEKIEKFRKDIVQALIRMRKNSIQIIKKNKTSNRTNQLADNTFILCNDVNDFYAKSIFYFEQVVAQESPIFLANYLSPLANMLSVSMSIMGEKEREELLQYYYEWTDTKPSDFISAIESVLNMEYDHINIAPTLEVLSRFIYLIDRLFTKMSDLEYIGQRKDNIVISEDQTMKKPKDGGSSSWSIFD